jgi:hypothetical protein
MTCPECQQSIEVVTETNHDLESASRESEKRRLKPRKHRVLVLVSVAVVIALSGIVLHHVANTGKAAVSRQADSKGVPSKETKAVNPIAESTGLPIPGLAEVRPRRTDDNVFSGIWSVLKQALIAEGHPADLLGAFTNPQVMGEQLVAIHPRLITHAEAKRLAEVSGAKILDFTQIKHVDPITLIEWFRGAYLDQTREHWRLAGYGSAGLSGISPLGRSELWPLQDEDESLRSLFLFTWNVRPALLAKIAQEHPGRPSASASTDEWRKYFVAEWEAKAKLPNHHFTRHVFFANGTVQRWQNEMADPRYNRSIFAVSPGPSWKAKTFRWVVVGPGEISILGEDGTEFDRLRLANSYPDTLDSTKHGPLVKVARQWKQPLESRFQSTIDPMPLWQDTEATEVDGLQFYNQGATNLCVGFSISMALQQVWQKPYGREMFYRICDISSGGKSAESEDTVGMDFILTALGIPFQTIQFSHGIPFKSQHDGDCYWILKKTMHGHSQGKIFDRKRILIKDKPEDIAARKLYLEQVIIPTLREGHMMLILIRYHKVRRNHQVALWGYSHSTGETTLLDSAGSKPVKVNLVEWIENHINPIGEHCFDTRAYVLPKAVRKPLRNLELPERVMLSTSAESLEFCNIGHRPLENKRDTSEMGTISPAKGFQLPRGLIAVNLSDIGQIGKNRLDEPAFVESRLWLLKFNVANGRCTYIARGRSPHDYQVCLVDGYRPGEIRLSYPVFDAEGMVALRIESEWVGEAELIHSMKIQWHYKMDQQSNLYVPSDDPLRKSQLDWAKEGLKRASDDRRESWERIVKGLEQPQVSMYYFHNMKNPYLDFAEPTSK